MKRILRILHIAALVLLCLTGVLASALLLQGHLYSGTAHAWVDAACDESDEGGVSNCEKVIHSRWGKVLGIPTAFWGLIYFSGLALWFLFIGQPSPKKRYWHVLPTLGTLAGAAGSLFFTVIMFARLEQTCTWCTAAHVANLLVLILTILLWPQRPVPTREYTSGTILAAEDRAQMHPSTRLVLAVSLLATLTAVCGAQVVAASAARTSIETIRAIAKVMHQLYQDEPTSGIPSRPDDPQRTAGDDRFHVPIVVFTDFACVHCQQLATALKTDFNPLFDNHLQIIFKHYPLCSDCNPHVRTQSKARSCRAARAAEVARIQGGNDAFWRAHDILFGKARLRLLGKMDYRELARELNLDPDQFIADMKSDEVISRIREDADLGRSLGVNSTPAVFVSGRRIPDWVAMRPDFWKAVAHIYKTKVMTQNKSTTHSVPTFREDPVSSRLPPLRNDTRDSLGGQTVFAAPELESQTRSSDRERSAGYWPVASSSLQSPQLVPLNFTACGPDGTGPAVPTQLHQPVDDRRKCQCVF